MSPTGIPPARPRRIRPRYGPRCRNLGLGAGLLGGLAVLLLLWARHVGDAGWAVLETLGLASVAMAAIVAWPFAAEAWLLRRGPRIMGTVITRVSSWVVYEYRERDDLGTEPIRARMRVPSRDAAGLSPGDRVAIFHSLWRPAHSVIEVLSVYAIIPPR